MPDNTNTQSESTHISDTFVPEVFGNYVLNQSRKTNRLIASGILTPDPDLGPRLTEPGTKITVPFVNDLYGDPDNWTDTDDIKMNKLSTGKQMGIKSYQAKRFGWTDLSETVSGAPLEQTIATRFANFWNTADNVHLVKLLQGVMNVDKVHDAKVFDATTVTPSQAQFDARGFLASIGLMGDVDNPTLTRIAVNSATYSMMKAQNLIDTVQPSAGGLPIAIYNGMQIVRDDEIPVDLSDKTKPSTISYIFAPGAVRYSAAMLASDPWYDPNKDGGTRSITQKRISVMHVAGTSVKTDFSPAKSGFPTFDEMADSKTWEVVDGIDAKSIGVVAYKAELDPMFVSGADATGENNKGTGDSKDAKK